MDISYQATSTESFETMNRHHDGQGVRGLHTWRFRVSTAQTNEKSPIIRPYGYGPYHRKIRIRIIRYRIRTRIDFVVSSLKPPLDRGGGESELEADVRGRRQDW